MVLEALIAQYLSSLARGQEGVKEEGEEMDAYDTESGGKCAGMRDSAVGAWRNTRSAEPPQCGNLEDQRVQTADQREAMKASLDSWFVALPERFKLPSAAAMKLLDVTRYPVQDAFVSSLLPFLYLNYTTITYPSPYVLATA